MTTYVIGYDLHEGEDYKDLIDAIKAYGSYWHCLDSTWIIKTDSKASEIKDDLKQHLKEGDKLIVIKQGNNWACYGCDGKCSKWLS